METFLYLISSKNVVVHFTTEAILRFPVKFTNLQKIDYSPTICYVYLNTAKHISRLKLVSRL